jgi:hypothetical protein
MRFEDELRRALRPVEPPDGFEERVRARIAERQPAGPVRDARSRLPGMRGWLAAAASLVALSAGTWYYERRQADDEGVRAARDVQVALQIASEKLSIVERRVNRSAEP